jgi:hypothetical protein
MNSRRLMVRPQIEDLMLPHYQSNEAPWVHHSKLCRSTSGSGRVSRASPVHTAVRNCTRDEGGPFEFGNQVLISSHRKLLLSKAMVVSVAETPGHDPGRQG